VLEGGSVVSDGAGTILTTEQCLLSPSRNPSLSRGAIEEALAEHLGAERIVWLGQGLIEDRDTDGHVDLIAAFTPDRRVLLQGVQAGNHNTANVTANLERLADARLESVVIPLLPYDDVAGERVAVSYLNLYICNGAVIVPVSEHEFDDEALAIIGSVFPGRSVVPVPGSTIAYGGGGPHCITQQVPAI
jgi:agmatine deiminase